MKRRFSNMSIMLLLVVILMIIYNIVELNRESQVFYRAQIFRDVSKLTLEFEKRIQSEIVRLETVRDTIGNMSLKEFTYSEFENRHLMIDRACELDDELYVVLKDGRRFSTLDSPLPPGIDLRVLEWYGDAFEKETTTVSTAYEDTVTGELKITISAPLYIENRLEGVIAADITLRDLTFHLKELELSDGVYAYLIGSSGMLLAHTTHDEWVGSKLDSIGPLVGEEKIMKAFTGIEEVIAYEVYDKEVTSTMYLIPEAHWLLGVAIQSDELLKAKVNLSPNVVIINSVFFLIILLLLREFYISNQMLHSVNQKLAVKSETDPLTGIKNRGYFDDIMDKYWNRATHKKETIALVLFDVDYFKKYNDNYGHIKGDEVLVDLCKKVSKILEEGDVFARYGGEEFVIIRYGINMKQVYDLGKSIVNAIYSAEIDHSGSSLGRLTVSAGVNVCIPKENQSIGEFIYKADVALYEAKSMGKNRVVKADE